MKVFLITRFIKRDVMGILLCGILYFSLASSIHPNNTRAVVNNGDPDSYMFWRNEQSKLFGQEIILTIPTGTRVVLYRHENPLQFHGHNAQLHKFTANIQSAYFVPQDMTDLTSYLKKNKGHFVLGLVPESENKLKNSGSEIELITSLFNGDRYEIINIYSNGIDLLLVEMEKLNRKGEAGEYFNWRVQKIYLETQ